LPWCFGNAYFKQNMTKILQKTIQFTFILTSFYSLLVLSFVWWHCYTSDLHGGKNGQLDAYRHTLASALVAYTTSPKLVSLVSTVMERKNQPANLMDKHNNAIGAQLGTRANALAALSSQVKTLVLQGAVNTSISSQITWLPTQAWGENVWF
jgi:hypothetical protein